jgi:hypothetical protein
MEPWNDSLPAGVVGQGQVEQGRERRAAMLPRGSSVPPLLEELQQAHSSLLLAIGELDRIRSGPPPSEVELVNARWRVSRASLARRLLWGRVLARLAPLVRGRGEADLRFVQEQDIGLLKASVNHVAAWKPADAIAAWRIYAAAESDLLQKMVGAVELEKRLLYPLLEEVERQAA